MRQAADRLYLFGLRRQQRRAVGNGRHHQDRIAQLRVPPGGKTLALLAGGVKLRAGDRFAPEKTLADVRPQLQAVALNGFPLRLPGFVAVTLAEGELDIILVRQRRAERRYRAE